MPFLKENIPLKADAGVILHFGQQEAPLLHPLEQMNALKTIFLVLFVFILIATITVF